MSDITHLPTRAEFMRDRLAEHLDGLGWTVETITPRTVFEWPAMLSAGNVAQDFELYVDTLGVVRDLEDDTVCRFYYAWHPEPTDTGVLHGPMGYHWAGTHDWATASLHVNETVSAALGFPVGHRVPGTTRTV